MIADRGLHRRHAASEWHVHSFHFGDLAEKIFRTDMRTGSDAGTAVGEALRLAVLNELLQVLHRIARMDGENDRAERDDGDGAQIIDRESLVSGNGLADRKAGGGGEYGVTVGRRVTYRLCCETPTGATAILHHHGTSEALAQFLPDRAGDDVRDAASCEADPESDVFRRIGLRQSSLREAGYDRRHEYAKLGTKSAHAASSRRPFRPAVGNTPVGSEDLGSALCRLMNTMVARRRCCAPLHPKLNLNAANFRLGTLTV